MSKTKRTLPTLEDVALAAKVSTATVSRCLNEPAKVSEATRVRVLEAVEALRYTPNFGARAIAANRTGIFGAIIPTMENAIFARGIEAFQAELVAHNATMLVASSAYSPEQEAKLVRTMVGRGADGLLLIGTERDPEIYTFLKDRNIPYVIAWGRARDPSHSYVGFDNRSATASLVSKALEMGHETIVYISAVTATNDRARERVLGARDALGQAGLDPAQMPVIETDYSIANGQSAFRELWTQRPSLTLVICGNDVLGVGAVKSALELGLRVPEDISVIGFDDIELAQVVHPALTTVHVPHRDMGRRAAEALLALVGDVAGPIRVDLQTDIVMRGSLGVPRLP